MNIRTLGAVALIMAAPLVVRAQEETKPTDRSMDIRELVDRVAKKSGKLFIVDPRVRAEVPLVGLDPSKVDYPRLLAILRVNLFSASEVKGVVTIEPDANARQMPTPVYADLRFSALDDELVTVLLDVKNACAPQLVPVLRPLMPQAAHMAAYPQSNTLILSDHADNVRRIGQIVEKLDRSAPAGQKCQATDGARAGGSGS